MFFMAFNYQNLKLSTFLLRSFLRKFLISLDKKLQPKHLYIWFSYLKNFYFVLYGFILVSVKSKNPLSTLELYLFNYEILLHFIITLKCNLLSAVEAMVQGVQGANKDRFIWLENSL